MKKFFIKKIIPIVLLITLISYTAPVFAFTKDETVYSKLNSNGKQYRTIVSTHINNENNLDKVTDLTNLLNIENTSGDETFSENGETLIWDAKGNDIYYQGETEEKLPIELEIKYKLDGNEMSAEDIAGKSGKVKIKLEYKNNDEHIVNVNGRNEKMYTPFFVVSGTILKNNNNKNIEVTNGKVINDGTKSIVIGIALPGLQESLNVSKDIVDIPSGMEITMDTTNFELGSIITFASPKVLDEENTNNTQEIKDLCNKINLIKEATTTLKAGTDTLKAGTEEYSQKSELFNSKMKELQNGVGYINSQYTAFDAGVNKLNVGTAQLYVGAQKLPETLEEIVTNLNTIKTSQEGLLTQTSIPTITANGVNKMILSDAEIIAIQNSNIPDAQKQAIMAKLITASGTLEQTNLGIGQMKAGIENELTSEDSNLAKLNAGITAIYGGVSDLTTNSSKIKGGLGNLNSSTTALKEADDALTYGAKTISDGVNQLSEGVETFNAEINRYLNGAINQISIRAEKLIKLSENYNNFTKINEQENGKVKFIMMTDDLRKKEEE